MKKRKNENSTSNVEGKGDVENCDHWDVDIDVYNGGTMEGNLAVKDKNMSPTAVIGECSNILIDFIGDNHDGHSTKPKKTSNVHAYCQKKNKMWELRLLYHASKGVKGKIKTVSGYPSEESALADADRFRVFYENPQVKGVKFLLLIHRAQFQKLYRQFHCI